MSLFQMTGQMYDNAHCPLRPIGMRNVWVPAEERRVREQQKIISIYISVYGGVEFVMTVKQILRETG